MKHSGARILLAIALVSGGLAAVPGVTAQAATVGTVNATHVKTTWTGGTNSNWSPPSPDPSGITYNSRTGKLIISDGEVEETNLSWHVWKGTNLYVASRGGTLLEPVNLDTSNARNTLAYSKEPTGVGFRPALSSSFPERLFVSDDDQAKIFEVDAVNGTYGDSDDRWTASSVAFLNLGARNDAEDVAVNLDTTKNGQLLLVDGKGKRAFLYNPGTDRVFNGSGDFVEKVIDLGAMGAGDPEGIAYNASRDTMFVVDDPSNRIYEVALDGTLLNRITLPFTMKSGAGIALAPPSSSSSLVCGTSTSVACNAYIVDRGVDNDSNSSTFNDGRLYEIAIPGLTGGGTSTTPTNTAPTANAGADQTITLPSSATLDGTVSDSTPTGTLTSLWTKVSGAGTVTFGSATATDTTASFSTSDTYVLRLTASDGSATHSDDVQVVVNPSSSTGGGTTGALDIPVRASTDDAEQRSASVVTSSGDLNLVLDGSTVQTVGMRFTGVNVPKGVTIKNAWVQFQVDEVSTGGSSLKIEGQAADNAATFAAVAGDIGNRPRTAAYASWAPGEWLTAGARTAAQRTDNNLASVVQEVVNRPGWASGNAVALIVTGSGARIAESYDGGASKAPVLHIDW